MEGSSAQSEWLALVPDEGWSDHSQGGALFATANRHHGALTEAGYTAIGDGHGWSASDLSGRIPLMELVCGEVSYLRRRFRHGGLLRAVTGERFRDPLRPLAEIRMALELAKHGVHAPEFVAARAQPVSRTLWRLDLISRRIPSAKDLESVMAGAHRGELDRGQANQLLRSFGRAVARLHAARFLHADLTPKNVLVEAGEIVFLDLDRSHFSDTELTDLERQTNLRRLYRYVERRESHAARRFLQRTDYLRFLFAYAKARGQETTREDWRAIESGHSKAAGTHRAGWIAEHLFTRGRGTTGPTWRD